MKPKDGSMISRLCRNSTWLDSLSDDHRRAIINRLLKILAQPESTNREATAAIRAIATLEKNDIERARLELQEGLGEDMGEFRDALDEIKDALNKRAEQSEST